MPIVDIDPKDYDFPKPLQKVLDQIKSGTDVQQRKWHILHKALASYTAGSTAASLWGLSNASDFVLSSAVTPKYFGQGFANHASTLKLRNGRYDYVDPTDKYLRVWMDFADYNLGGGTFNNGFAQEEGMALEMPQLASAAAPGFPDKTKGFHTRTNGDVGAEVSSPEPLLLTHVHHTVFMDSGLTSNDGWKTIDINKIEDHVHPLPSNQVINVLAVAVPNLAGSKEDPKSQKTINDLFNTYVAGFTLALHHQSPSLTATVVNTGPSGTGVFLNDKETVFVMQNLAAMQVGKMDLTYWDSSLVDSSGTVTATGKAYEKKLSDIVGAYKSSSDKNKNVTTLLTIAHNELNKK